LSSTLHCNMLLLEQFGYYGGDSLDETHRLVEDKLTTWDEHLRASKKWGEELKQATVV